MATNTVSNAQTDSETPTIEVTETTEVDGKAKKQEHRAQHSPQHPHHTHDHAVIHPASPGASHLNPGGIRFGR